MLLVHFYSLDFSHLEKVVAELIRLFQVFGDACIRVEPKQGRWLFVRHLINVFQILCLVEISFWELVIEKSKGPEIIFKYIFVVKIFQDGAKDSRIPFIGHSTSIVALSSQIFQSTEGDS